MKTIPSVMLLLFLGVFASDSIGQGSLALSRSAAQSESESRRIVADVLKRLDAAWNASDGKAFAEEFSEDAEVINIFGGVFHGRSAVEQRMQTIFNTIFKGSVHKARELESARLLAPRVVIAVSSAVIQVPSGPLAPEARNRQTLLLMNVNGAWKIIHWQNTPVQNGP